MYYDYCASAALVLEALSPCLVVEADPRHLVHGGHLDVAVLGAKGGARLHLRRGRLVAARQPRAEHQLPPAAAAHARTPLAGGAVQPVVAQGLAESLSEVAVEVGVDDGVQRGVEITWRRRERAGVRCMEDTRTRVVDQTCPFYMTDISSSGDRSCTQTPK